MLQRMGFPDVTGHRRFVTAVAVDAVGTGVFMPVSLLYFIATTSLSMDQVGLAASIAAAVSLPFILVVGHIVDRVGAKRVLLVANLAQAVGLAGYTVADQLWQVIGLMAIVGLGQSAFWAGYSPMVAAISRPGERELWFGFLGALRNIGFAVGGLLSGVLVAIGSTVVYRAMVLANAASYVGAFVLFAGVAAGAKVIADHEQDHAPWSVALRDGPFRYLIGANICYALCGIALNIAMPVYAATVLHLPGWIVGAIFTVNTVMVGFGQGLVVRRMTGHRRYRIALLANVMFAIGFVMLGGVSMLPIVGACILVIAAVVVYTFGELLGGPVLTTVAVDSRPAHLRGRYMSLYQLSWNVASIISPALFTALLARGPWPVWVALCGVSAIGAVLVRAMAAHLPVAAARVTNASPESAPLVDEPALG